ncbi:hypothetical protein L4C33_14840, partial [Vibrio makurazakiensis]|uniref:hypothetical protein n=1 Tax=Vibrio makurazakiensis TaxID=2910250 RepID=UPI003D0DC5A2
MNKESHHQVNSSRRLKVNVLGLMIVASLTGCKYVEPLISQPASALETGVPEFIGEVVEANSLPEHSLPVDNPYLSALGKNGLHYDNYNSDVTNFSGPLGNAYTLTSHRLNAQAIACPTILFNRQELLVTVCLEYGATRLLLIEPNSLSIIAEHELPPKLNKGDASGGGYAHLDNND